MMILEHNVLVLKLQGQH